MRNRFLTACLCACVLLSLAHASIDKKLQEAHKQRAGGNIAGAISTLRSITTKHPDNARALALLGDTLFESGDATEAHAVYATHDDHTHLHMHIHTHTHIHTHIHTHMLSLSRCVTAP